MVGDLPGASGVGSLEPPTFDPTPLPHRPVEWRRALAALRSFGEGYEGRRVMDYGCALEGDEGERDFQAFLAEPGARALLRERPRLPACLDDFEALACLPRGSLGRSYLRLARRDGIRVAELVEGQEALPEERERAPDPVRRWYRARLTALHDLLHVLTGYDRDPPGELLLLAFSQAVTPRRVFRVSLSLGLLTVPGRRLPAFTRDLLAAWRRGRAARIPKAARFEALLPLPLEEARARLGIRPPGAAHPRGLWREVAPGGGWERATP